MAAKPNHIKRIRAIWEKTGGRCHFCGDPVKLHRRGYSGERSDGSWEIDHVTQRSKGGKSGIENYLPACTPCNRLRWHRTGPQLRRLLKLGIVAGGEVAKLTDIGKALIRLEDRRYRQTRGRRRGYEDRGRLTDPVVIEQRRRDQRAVLVACLHKNRQRQFTVDELSKKTGVSKRWIRPLLGLSRIVQIEPNGRAYLYRARGRIASKNGPS